MAESQLDILIDQNEEISGKLDEIKSAIEEIQFPEIPKEVSISEAEILIEKIQGVVDAVQKIKTPEQKEFRIDLSPLVDLLRQIKDKKIELNFEDVLSSLNDIKKSIPEIDTSGLEKLLKDIVSSLQKIKFPENKDYTDDLKKIEKAIKNISISYTGPSSVGIRNAGDTRINPATEDGNLAKIPGIAIPIHDRIELSYAAGNLTQVVYKQGGVTGTIVATLNLSYDVNGNLISVSKS
jgi:hypothetical protein